MIGQILSSLVILLVYNTHLSWWERAEMRKDEASCFRSLLEREVHEHNVLNHQVLSLQYTCNSLEIHAGT